MSVADCDRDGLIDSKGILACTYCKTAFDTEEAWSCSIEEEDGYTSSAACPICGRQIYLHSESWNEATIGCDFCDADFWFEILSGDLVLGDRCLNPPLSTAHDREYEELRDPYDPNLCMRCGWEYPIDDERCPSCGKKNPEYRKHDEWPPRPEDVD